MIDKSIERIINPPRLEPTQRMEKQMGAVTFALQESEAMRSIRKLSESTRLALLAFKISITAAGTLNDKVFPFFKQQELPTL